MNEDIKDLERSLPKLAHQIELLHENRKAVVKSTRGNFNVFTAVLPAHDETRLHSRFIKYLLNPEANHGCGREFLDLFIETLSEDKLLPQSKSDTVKFKKEIFKEIKGIKCKEVRTEKPANNNRRIDIYLEFDNHVIAIENKIYANEQPSQIADYADFINSKEPNNFLFYLTLFGKESYTDKNKETNEKVEYFSISYSEHIINWLERCLKDTYRLPNVNQGIQQYQNVVKELTHQTLEYEDMKEIKEIIKRNPKIIQYHSDIEKTVNELKDEWRNSLWNKLKREFNVLERTFDYYKQWKCECLFINESVDININDKIYPVKFIIEINLPDNVLKTGLGTHNDYDEETKKIIYDAVKNIEGYKSDGNDNSWWIVGQKIIRDEIEGRCMAENFSESEIEKFASLISQEIKTYISTVKEWCNT